MRGCSRPSRRRSTRWHGLLDDLRQGRQDAEQALDRVDQRIALAADRAENLSNMVESAEVNLAVLAGRAARKSGEGRRK
ncbi:MAG: hypothetical protein IID28_09115 [Planctomycetes bacterium]|nr:hypothetical protein [Planctomycetota bacterium]